MVWAKKGNDFVVVIFRIPEEHRDQNKNTEPVITMLGTMSLTAKQAAKVHRLDFN